MLGMVATARAHRANPGYRLPRISAQGLAQLSVVTLSLVARAVATLMLADQPAQ